MPPKKRKTGFLQGLAWRRIEEAFRSPACAARYGDSRTIAIWRLEQVMHIAIENEQQYT
jgi:hypothetical protein